MTAKVIISLKADVSQWNNFYGKMGVSVDAAINSGQIISISPYTWMLNKNDWAFVARIIEAADAHKIPTTIIETNMDLVTQLHH
ncbi:hypothetical protein ACFQ2T_04830 [Methylophilus flavus]|uniref:Uncharacterized protein n=1 Tax=Methylophilus flavus TaxID=640084 RepID=A0ABW3PDA6_9PROT